MSNAIVVLSDSDEVGSSSDDNEEDKKSEEEEEEANEGATSDFDFPEVPFCRETVREISRSEANFVGANVNDDVPSGLNDSEDDDDRVGKSSRRKATLKKKNGTAMMDERSRRRQEKDREKALRAIEKKKSRDVKPGECMKFMEVELDSGIDAFVFHKDIKSTLLNADVKFNVIAQLIPNSITWRRNIEENYVGDDNQVRVRKSSQPEKHAIVIWDSCQTVSHVADDTFCAVVRSTCDLIPDHTVTLVIFGTEDYFAYRKKRKSARNPGGKGSRCNNNDGRFKTLPVISRQQLELCLTEIQLNLRCNSRSIENAQDLALMVYQYTKSISEIPYKSRKESQENKFDWYATGDNRNTVRVDRNGNGLKRLWQQQLCQFNLCGLEIAEAICAVYPSPARLFKAYENCTPEEGMNLLKDIPIRRAAGPLTAVRKVGPELSKKIYIMFTSENGDNPLE
ncbi:crossover junction endonuclease EME1 [Pseudomyrmex gracilis]|uniref:crossover junction endonuclease EME1 n=1 Tax=Pseudomyrmex gracilis TaxID=219809 RepID=UPI0009950CCD|nr:crossover junction endonuclease EME1 [Pseudomyrmex gracilis]